MIGPRTGTCTPTSGATTSTTPDALASPLGEGRFAGKTPADVLAAVGADGLDAVVPDVRPQPARPRRRGRRGRQGAGRARRRRAAGRPAAVRRRGPGRPGELAAGAHVWRANLLGSSAKGNEYFLQHLLGHRRRRCGAEEAPPEARPTDVVWRDEAPDRQARPAAVAGLPDDQHDAVLRRRAAGGDLVREARPQHHRHAPVRARVHAGDQPAVADPHRLRRLPRHRAGVRRAGRPTHLGVRRDLVAVPLLHDTPDELANPRGVVRDWKAGECDPVPGPTMPKFVVVERDYGAVAAEDGRARAAARAARRDHQGRRRSMPDEEVELPAAQERHGPRRGRRRPAVAGPGHATGARRSSRCPARRTGGWPPQGFEHARASAPACGWPTSPPSTRASRSRFADTQSRPVPVITSPEWSGSETGGRRYSPFTINVERLKPWHTLTGRQHFFLDHDWMTELGEQLPVFRPPLDMHTPVRRAAGRAQTGELGLTVRYLTPHNKWSIHSEYQDNLFMLSLSRGGQTIWMSDRDAAKIGIARQRLDRGGQPQRRRRGPGDRVAPHARGHRLHAPRPGPADRRPADGDHRPARRHPQLADPAVPQTDATSSAGTRSCRSPSTTSARRATSATRSP